MIRIYTQLQQGRRWLQRHQGKRPALAIVLGFTETGLIPGISAAGATPQARRYTAVADAEYLYYGWQPQPCYPLPPLTVGASPVLISRAVAQALDIPVYIFDAGLPLVSAAPTVNLGGMPAQCLSTAQALPLPVVQHLWEQGLTWGRKLAAGADYLIIGECVVGGTTTALAVLTALGIAAGGRVSSSHRHCNHRQKIELVQRGLSKLKGRSLDPLSLLAAVGDPMQIVAAGMAVGAAPQGVMLAGGTQMLAVFILMRALVQQLDLEVDWHNLVIGTTAWVTEDATADPVGLAKLIGSVPLLATELSMKQSKYAALRAYDQGYVKEGVAAGAMAIAAHLMGGLTGPELLELIEAKARELGAA